MTYLRSGVDSTVITPLGDFDMRPNCGGVEVFFSVSWVKRFSEMNM